MRLHQRGLELLKQKREQFAAAGSLQALPKNVTVTDTAKSGSKGRCCQMRGAIIGRLLEAQDVVQQVYVVACLQFSVAV